MNKYELIRLSKNLVKEYFNRYVVNKENNIKKIQSNSVVLLKYKEGRRYIRVLLGVPNHNMGYKVTYNKKTEEIETLIIN